MGKSQCERQPSRWCFVRMNHLFVCSSQSANKVKESVNKASGDVFLSLTFSFFNEGLLSGSTNHANEKSWNEDNAIKITALNNISDCCHNVSFTTHL